MSTTANSSEFTDISVDLEKKDQPEKLEQHPFLMLIIILGIVAIAANFIPSGVYERIVVDGRTIVDPTTYQLVDKQYTTINDFFLSFYYGFLKASGLIAMVFFVGGAFGVVKRIGLMDATIKYLAHRLQGASFLSMSITIMTLVGLLVSFTGVWELSLVILPLIIPLCLKLGYDVMVGTALVMVAACAGLAASFTNPFFTAVAHTIAELPIYSGLWYRAITFVIFLVVGVIYISLYARKIKANPERSILLGVKPKYEQLDDTPVEFSAKLKRAGIAFILLFGFLIYGTVFKGFSFAEMSATFVAIGFLVGIAHGSRLNEICHMFAKGMGDLMIAGLVIFFARAILYIMEQTQVIDTVIYFLAGFAEGTSEYISAAFIFFIQTIINGIIPSGSGQAAITLPILVPLADITGIMRQVVCYASQIGDGLSNFIYPTNGALIAILSVAGVPYIKWFKFFAPLFAILATIATIMVVIAQYINLGPF